MRDSIDSAVVESDSVEGVIIDDGAGLEKILWAFVVHQRPDTDALACLWAANKFIGGGDDELFRNFFIESSSVLDPEDLARFDNVLYMDVGGGDCDQHGRGLKNASSFQLLLEKFGLLEMHPGLKPILDLTIASDNVHEIDATSIHYILKGMPSYLKDEKGQTDWNAVVSQAFMLFDILYSHTRQCRSSELEYRELSRKLDIEHVLRNGYGIAELQWKPGLREAAYKKGADVVFWTTHHKKYFEVGIQVNRFSDATLRGCVRALRLAEASARRITLTEEELSEIGLPERMTTWFMHDSLKLIVAGSRSRHLEGDEHTKLKPHQILTIIKNEIGKLPAKDSANQRT
jgi:hypothetical protein